MSLISRRLALSSLAGLGLSAVGLGCNPSNSGTAASSTGETGKASAAPKSYELLNVSYDPTRELWKQINAAFSKKFASSVQ